MPWDDTGWQPATWHQCWRIGGLLGLYLFLDDHVFCCRWPWLCDRIDALALGDDDA